MTCFLQYLDLIIGDFVPKKNKTWKLYTVLRKMVSIIMAREVTNKDIDLLKEVIRSEHHTLYINLFDMLKPKHHLLLHYLRIMKQFGPLREMYTYTYISIRFEAKHKELK